MTGGVAQAKKLSNISKLPQCDPPGTSRCKNHRQKEVEAKALPTNDARVVCKFLKSLFARFGAPRAIISDRGTHFCNDQFAKVMLKYGVTHRLSTAYHPQTSVRLKDIPLDSVVVLRYEKRSKCEYNGKVTTEMELVLEQTQQGTSYGVSVSAEGVKELKRKVKIQHEKKEALLTLRFDTSAVNPVKEILLKLNLPDYRILKDGGEESCLIQAFKTKKQQQYEHASPKVTSSQYGKVYKIAKRDYDWLMISRCSRSHSRIQVKIKEQAQA
ncbi:reverse transcriptase domain-containing protein [Tanacetum coccineum]